MSATSPIKLEIIPNLPSSTTAQSLLQRLLDEFTPIITHRNYNIVSLTEMCCCADGIKRKPKLMPPNVNGYNLTHGRRHYIHIRLRNPKSHKLLPYRDIANVMIHELAHCKIGPHSAEFYELMEEIEGQYCRLVSRGVLLDRHNFPVKTDQCYRLGGGGGNSTTTSVRQNAAKAAMQRWQSNQPPKEEERQRQQTKDSNWCIPPQTIIHILDDDDDDDDDNVDDSNDSDSDCQIISVKPESDSECQIVSIKPPPAKKPKTTPCTWTCTVCTCINQPLHLVCIACDSPKISLLEQEAQIREVVPNERQKEEEVQRSVDQFGFDIYNSHTSSTSTLKHLT